jgi:hypothetical protein
MSLENSGVDITKGDPRELLEAADANALEVLEKFILNGKKNLNDCFEYHIQKLLEIIVIQGKELLLFRTLEAHTRNKTLTNELLTGILGEIQSLRAAAMEEAKKQIAA